MKLRSKVGCQELIRMGVVKERGEIPANYKASESMITPAIVDLEMSSTDTGPSTSVTGQSTLSSTAADAADPSATDNTTFDDLRLAEFSSSALKMDFEKTPCTSTNTRKHIQRAYYQMQMWVQAPFRDATTTMNAESYGYVRRDSSLVPEFVISKPDNLPDPCTCGKCARKNGCRCRIAGIKCCKYCKCKGGDCCRNPITE